MLNAQTWTIMPVLFVGVIHIYKSLSICFCEFHLWPFHSRNLHSTSQVSFIFQRKRKFNNDIERIYELFHCIVTHLMPYFGNPTKVCEEFKLGAWISNNGGFVQFYNCTWNQMKNLNAGDKIENYPDPLRKSHGM